MGVSVPARYECWGPDREDFTQRLRDRFDHGKLPIFFFRGRQKRWRFEYTCPQGHKNVFTGVGRP